MDGLTLIIVVPLLVLWLMGLRSMIRTWRTEPQVRRPMIRGMVYALLLAIWLIAIIVGFICKYSTISVNL